MGALLPLFEHASGHKVTIKFQAGPQTLGQLKEGAGIDLLIADEEVIDDFVKDGVIAAGGSTKVMLSRVGVAVQLRRAQAQYRLGRRPQGGAHCGEVGRLQPGCERPAFPDRDRAAGSRRHPQAQDVIVQGKPVGAAVAAGEAEIGVQQVAELMPVPGIDLVGPLPGDLQKIIVYVAAIPAKAKDPEGAKALAKFFPRKRP